MRRALLTALSCVAFLVVREGAVASPSAVAPSPSPSTVSQSPSPPARAERPGLPPGEAYLWGLVVPLGVVNNNFSNGFSQVPSLGARCGATFPFFGQMLMIAGQFYETASSYGDRTIGDPPYLASAGIYRYDTMDARAGVRLPLAGLYAGLSTLYASPPAPSSSVPDMVGLGLGLEVPPDLHRALSVFWKVYFYSNIQGEDLYNDPITRQGLNLRYSQISYDLGVAQRVGKSNGFVTASLGGDSIKKLATLPPTFPGSGHSVLLSLGYAFRVSGGGAAR